MRKILIWLVLLLLVAPAARAQVGALQTDCKLGGDTGDHGYQFVATCAGRALSPDGRWAVVQKAYSDTQPPIELQDGRGRVLARLPGLSDDMPFSVTWAPNSRWFFVNHHVGSFMDVLQIFEVRGNTVVERPALIRSAVREATKRYPCLSERSVSPNGVRWSRDSRKIVLFTISSLYACSETARRGDWHSLWMIGDVATGRIVRRSVRIQSDDKPLQMPRLGVYAAFVRPVG